MTIYRSLLVGETLLPGDERIIYSSWKPIAETLHNTKILGKQIRHRRAVTLEDILPKKVI